MAFLFNSAERLSRSNVGFEYSPFCLSGTASATIWCPLSALEQPFLEESNFIKELFFTLLRQHCPHTQIQVRSTTMRSPEQQRTIIAFTRYLVWLKKNPRHGKCASGTLFVNKPQIFHLQGFNSSVPCQMFLKWLTTPSL